MEVEAFKAKLNIFAIFNNFQIIWFLLFHKIWFKHEINLFFHQLLLWRVWRYQSGNQNS